MTLTVAEAQVVLRLADQLTGAGGDTDVHVAKLAFDVQWLTERAHRTLGAGHVPTVEDLAMGLHGATSEFLP